MNETSVSLFSLRSFCFSCPSFLFSFPLSTTLLLLLLSTLLHLAILLLNQACCCPPKSSLGSGKGIYEFMPKIKGKTTFFEDNRFEYFSYYALYTKTRFYFAGFCARAQYDEMRLSLVDGTFVAITDSMTEDTVEAVIRRLDPIDYQLIRLIQSSGPINHHRLKSELGEKGLKSMARCKARGLVVPVRKSQAYYSYDITDFALEVLKASESQPSQSSVHTII